jgi:hypothetical protein
MKRSVFSAIALALLVAAGSAPAQAQDRVERVQFAKGASSKAIQGRIAGEQGVVYIVGAREGQTLSVDLKTSNGANDFNVTAPGANEALFIGSTSGNSYRGTLPTTGDYRIQVYLMRNAARRNEAANYTLSIAVTGPSAGAVTRGSPDAKVAGTDYQATAMVGCALGAGAPLGRCKAGVMRFSGGEATVEITLPGSGQRHVYFKGTAAQSSNSPTGGFSARKDGDLNVISVGGKERYEFPDAFVTGD